jgi:hypothetical protein
MSKLKQLGSAYASMIAHNKFEERDRLIRAAKEKQALAAVESRIILEEFAQLITLENLEAIMMEDRTITQMEYYKIPLPDGIEEPFSTAMRGHNFGGYESDKDFIDLCKIAGVPALGAMLQEMIDNDFGFQIDKGEDGKRSFLFWYYGN